MALFHRPTLNNRAVFPYLVQLIAKCITKWLGAYEWRGDHIKYKVLWGRRFSIDVPSTSMDNTRVFATYGAPGGVTIFLTHDMKRHVWRSPTLARHLKIVW